MLDQKSARSVIARLEEGEACDGVLPAVAHLRCSAAGRCTAEPKCPASACSRAAQTLGHNAGAHLLSLRSKPVVGAVPSYESLRLAGVTLIGLAEHDQQCEVADLDEEGRHKACTCGLDDAVSTIASAVKASPLTEAQIEAGTEEHGINSFKASAFHDGVRYAEKLHKIGGA